MTKSHFWPKLLLAPSGVQQSIRPVIFQYDIKLLQNIKLELYSLS